MSPERWQQVEMIFSEAIAFEADAERRRYVETACGDNDSLRIAVESLLHHHDDHHGSLSGFSSLVGKMLSHYQIMEEIGKGSTGTVYKAHDTKLGRSVALKVLRPILASDPDAARRFVQEGRYASLPTHPNIVTVYEIGEAERLSFIAMEYVDGHALNSIIPTSGLPVGICLHYAIQIADALVTAHSVGLIHRDLKPANLIVTQHHHLKVVDFGLAKARFGAALGQGSGKTLPGMILGTAGYMSPEQACGQECDARSDIFSTGAIMHEMMTGRRAFQHRDAIGAGENVDSSKLLPNVPAAAANIVRRCLDKDVNLRYQTASDLLADLQAGAAAWPTGSDRSDQRVNTSPWGYLRRPSIGGPIALILAVGFVFLIQQRPRRVTSVSTGSSDVSATAARQDTDAILTDPAVLADTRSAANRPWLHPIAADDSVLRRYNSGITHQEKSDTLCFDSPSNTCDVDGALVELKIQIADFSAVLGLRPYHAASLRNRGLAYQGLCELQSKKHEWAQARASCDEALADFDKVLKSGRRYGDLPNSAPMPGAVLWQKGLAYFLRAHISGSITSTGARSVTTSALPKPSAS